MGLRDLLFPLECVSCREWGTVLCMDCSRRVRSESSHPQVRTVPGKPVCEAQGAAPVTVYAAAQYGGPVAAVLLAYKRHPEKVLTDHLAAALRCAIAAIEVCPVPAVLVPVPTSRRSFVRRGFDPVAQLLAAAWEGGSLGGRFSLRPVLRRCGWGRGQKGLGVGERARNMEGAFALRWGQGSALRGRVCVLVDDVCTTGSTLLQAQGALLEAGAHCQQAAVIAAVPSRRGDE